MRVANRRVASTPSGFVRLETAPAHYDVRGVDLIARVRRRWAFWDVMSVPVQVKSSSHFVEKYYEHHPLAKRYGVVLIIVNESRTDADLRAELYREVMKARGLPRYHFKPFFDAIRTKPLTGRGKDLRRKIARGRSRKR